jgi:hypothetical protein
VADEGVSNIVTGEGSDELPPLPKGYEYGPGMRRGLPPVLFPLAKLMTSFARFSRSLGFYNSSNRAVGNFFEKLWEEMAAVLADRGEIDLRVTATAFMIDGEKIYEDSDREHSIPFRLFRDGIRRLHFSPDITGEELMALAKILGMRLTGVNRHGDDVVTRMWKADFKTIRYAEVKGFVQAGAGAGRSTQDAAVPEIMDRIKGRGKARRKPGKPRKPGSKRRGPGDKRGGPAGGPGGPDEAGAGGAGGGGAAGGEAGTGEDEKPELFHLATAEDDFDGFDPSDFIGGDMQARWLEGIYPGRQDYELEFEGTAVEIVYPELGEDEVGRVQSELEEEETNVLTRLVDYLLDLSMAEEETFEADQLHGLVRDGKRYLLSEGLVDELANLVGFLVDVETSGEYAEVMEELARDLLAGFYGEEALQQVVAAAPPDGDGPWYLREYLRALDALVSIDDLLTLLRCEMLPVFRRVLLDHLLESEGVDLAWLGDQLRIENDLDVMTAMDALALIEDETARATLARTIRHPSLDVRMHLLDLLSTYEYDEAARKALIWAMTDSDRDVRIRALELVIERKDPRTQAAMMELAELPDFEGWSRRRREMLLMAIASVGREEALSWLREKIKIPRIWGLLSTDQKAWNEHSLPALVEIGSDEALDTLRRFKDAGPADFRKKALRAYVELGRRRQAEAIARDGGEQA